MKKVGKRLLAVLLMTAMLFGAGTGVFPASIAVLAGEEKEAEYDYSFLISRNETLGTRLDEAFDIYYYGTDSKAAAGPSKPSEKATCQWYGTHNHGFLKFHETMNGNTVPQVNNTWDGRVATMTYSKEQMTDFTAEYSFFPGYSVEGLVFGGQLDQFPVTLDGDNSNDTGVMVSMDNSGQLNIIGAIDRSTTNYMGGTVDGTSYSTHSYFGTRVANVRGASLTGKKITPLSGTIPAGSTEYFTVVVTVKQGVLTVYEKNHPENIVTVALSDSYQGGYVSLFVNNCLQPAFRSFGITSLDQTTDYDVYYDFENTDLTKEDLTSTQFDGKNQYQPVEGKIDQPVLEQWFTGLSGYPSSVMPGRKIEGLKPKVHGELHHRLDLADYKDFEIAARMYRANNFGIAFGEKNVFPNTGRTSAVRVYLNASQIQVVGAVNLASAQASGKDLKNAYVYGEDTYIFQIEGFQVAGQANELVTMHVKVVDNVLSVWLEGYDALLTMKLSSAYYKQGSVSLLAKGPSEGGSFKTVWVNDLTTEAPGPEEPEVPAVEDDSFHSDFTAMTDITELDAAYDSYYFDTKTAEPLKGDPSEQWTTATNLSNYVAVFRNPWLKPVHQYNDERQTLLTYKSKRFRNIELEMEYVTSHIQYGVMIAPKGQLADAENGVRIYVEGNGVIRVQGAIDAASASAAGGYVRIAGKNALAGYAPEGYVKASESNTNEVNLTAYKLHVRILGKVLSVWLEEYPEYILSVGLTDAYAGGMVSLCSAGYNHGAFKSLAVKELKAPEEVPEQGVYTMSFNTIDSLDDLKDDFAAYTLDSAKNKPVSAAIEDIYRLNAGRLQSNLAEMGTDMSGFGILTLQNKRYENFELTLKYEQDSLRYTVMLGTEPGEFAFTEKGSRLNGNGGVLVYTEMEGYRNIRGSLYSSFYTEAALALCRVRGDKPLDSFHSFGSVVENLNRAVLHTMTIRVVDGYLTMVVDNEETSRVTVRLDEYDGGYISLVTNSRKSNTGAFCSLSVKELGKDAELLTPLPDISDGFETMTQVKELFEAYHLSDAKKSNKLEKVELEERWWLNNGGFLTRTQGANGVSEVEDVDILTYTKQRYEDFELTYTFQQTYQRLGIVIGSELSEYPLYYKDGRLTADRGAVLYVEAEGYPNVKGHLHNYSLGSDLLYRSTAFAGDGFRNAAGSAMDNVSAKKVHTVKVVVKDKQCYVFLDGSSEARLYVKLGDNYRGGYVSLFAFTNSAYGIGSFAIIDKVTTELPEAGGVKVDGGQLTAAFDAVKFDDSLFTAYYMEQLSGNKDGVMVEDEFDDQWTVVNKTLKRTTAIANGSDAVRVSALTYKKPLTDFVVTFDYQQYIQRLMFMFGAEKGKYALCNAGHGDQENGGVILYPEFDFGSGGGIVALGGVDPLLAAYRPISREKVSGLDYFIKADGEANQGKWHTMTIAVINKHCYIYIDDYGLVKDYALVDSYNGGYLSLAASGNGYGFANLTIRDLSSAGENVVVAAKDPDDITVAVGTDVSSLELPAAVDVTLKNGKTVKAAVDWINLNYNGAEPGVYRYTAIPKEGSGIENPAQVGVTNRIRVVEELPVSKKGVREWSFDTPDDLKDFKAYYLKNAETGYLKTGVPSWFVSSQGELRRDEFRAVPGDVYREVGILTYTGETYKNFELEVDYSQAFSRMMVLFGSKSAGAYIDLNDVHSEKNPVAAFVELEGVRNLLGNVKNTDYYTRSEKTIYTARENGDRLKDYFAGKAEENIGKMHTMKLRVVGDQASVWIDGQEDPFVVTLTNYEGGYISLASVTKGGVFDNLKITRLSDTEERVQATKVVANGHLDLTVDKDASTELEIPKREKPESFEKPEEKETETKPEPEQEHDRITSYIIAGVVIFMAAILGTGMILIARRKKKKGEHAQ